MFATAIRRSAYASGKAAAKMPNYQSGASRVASNFAGWAVWFAGFSTWPLMLQAYGQSFNDE